MSSQYIDALLENVRSWPKDEDELIAVVREIEARRAMVYLAGAEDLMAADDAERSRIATDEDVDPAFRSSGGHEV